MSQELPVNKFELIEDASQFVEDFIKNYNGESNEGYFLKVDLPFLPKRSKIELSKSLLLTYMIKLNMPFTYEIQCQY